MTRPVTGRVTAMTVLLSVACIILSGCATTPPDAAIGAEAYKLIPAENTGSFSPVDYRIGPLDVLTITVFQEKDLSLEEVPVDASGNIIFPLIGQIKVASSSSAEVSDLISKKLSERFLVNPQVSVLVKTSASQKVTVDGQVTEPGVYELQGTTTLLQSIAKAKGPSPIAKLDEVIIFRNIDGVRYAARFDLDAIRKGRALDPRIQGNDTVVVGFSKAKQFSKDFLTAAPALTNAFFAISQLTR